MNAIRRKDERKRRLISLERETLVDGLLLFATRHPDVDAWVERMTDTPEGNVAAFYSELEVLKAGYRYISWSQSHGYALELIDLLDTLESGEKDPKRGLEAVGDFFRADSSIMESVDDSNGEVGSVFAQEAVDLFVQYAKSCEDKVWVSQYWLEILASDDYGVREGLIGAAHRFLCRDDLFSLAQMCKQNADSEPPGSLRTHWLYLLSALARQLKDPVLFETSRSARADGASEAALLEIAREYQNNEMPSQALFFLNRLPTDMSFRAYERDRLLLQVFINLEKKDAAGDLALAMFRRHPSSDSLKTLIQIIGEEKRHWIIQDELDRRGKNEAFSVSFATLLLDEGWEGAAGGYIQARAKELNGDCYGSLQSLAMSLSTHGQTLAASLVYRALLDSILERAQSKAYPHGVGYLSELDRLSVHVGDWAGFESHKQYHSGLRSRYARRPAFWSKYKNISVTLLRPGLIEG